LDQLKARAARAIEQGGTDLLKNLVGTLAELGRIILDVILALTRDLAVPADRRSRILCPQLALVPAQHRAQVLFLEDNVSRVLGGYLRDQLTLAAIIGLAARVAQCSSVCRTPLCWGCSQVYSIRAHVRADSVGYFRGDRRAIHAISNRDVGASVFPGIATGGE
jgi:predicted PurR-regulated permease PerM